MCFIYLCNFIIFWIVFLIANNLLIGRCLWTASGERERSSVRRVARDCDHELPLRPGRGASLLGQVVQRRPRVLQLQPSLQVQGVFPTGNLTRRKFNKPIFINCNQLINKQGDNWIG